MSNKNYSICSAGDINGTVLTAGVIQSPNYPTFTSNQNCQRKIIAPDGKQVRVYITDLNIESPNGNE